MQTEKLAATRRLPIWVMVVGGMALAVSYAVAAILGISGILPAEVLVALKPVEQRIERASYWNIVRVDPAATGVAAGINWGLLGLLLGGVPVAILGTALAARRSNRGRRWSRAWGNVFLAGFVFQLSSVVFTAFLLVLGLWLAYAVSATALEILAFAGPLLFGVVCGLWGVRSWRVLQLQLQELPLTIAPHEGAG